MYSLAISLWRLTVFTLLSVVTVHAQMLRLKDYLPYTDGSTSTLDSDSGWSVTFGGAANDLFVWQVTGPDEGLQFIFKLDDTGLQLLTELGVTPDGENVIAVESYRPFWGLAPPVVEVGVPNMSTGSYEGTEDGEVPWSGASTGTLTVGAMESVTTPAGTYDAFPLTFVSEWNDGNALYSASGTTTQTWWTAKGEGVVKFRYAFEESVIDEGELETESGELEFLLTSNHIIPGPDTGPDPDLRPSTDSVDIPDFQLKRGLLAALKRADTDVAAAEITYGEMRTLKRLTISAVVAELTGLEAATSLLDLNLDVRGVVGKITDLSPISGLTQLVHLRFSGNQVEDISPIAGLTNLVSLRFSDNLVSDLSPLAGMADLNLLWVESNQITDLSPISGLGRLQFLAASSNQITDISSLSTLIRMGELSLNFNDITDISALESLKSLSKLSLQGNRISDVSILSEHQFFKWLGLGENEITDLSALGVYPRLTGASVHQNYLDVTPGSADRAVIDAWIAGGARVTFEPQKEGAPDGADVLPVLIFLEGDSIRLEWPSDVEASYGVEISTDLSSWLPTIPASMAGTGAAMFHRLPISMATGQFYRIVRN